MTANEARIRELESEITKRDNTILMQQNSINDLKRQVDNLTEILIQMRHDKFGPSSEQTVKADDGSQQVSIFNEVEVEADSTVQEPFKRNAKGDIAPRKKRVRNEMIIGDIPTEEIVLSLDESKLVCEVCNGKLKPIGREVVRQELQYIPSQLKLVKYVREAYECPACKHTDNPYIIKTVAPTSLMNHSLASPSSVAHVMYQKYMQGIPLYRQEKDWERMGILLSRATMANWVIRCAEDYLMPVTDYLRRKLLARDIVHADETPVQVLKEDGKKPQTKSYMWVYRTGNDGKEPIILFDYHPSRSGDNAATYLKDFKGYVHSDGYSGYNKLTEVTRCGCWAHLRRKFVEAIPTGKEAELRGSFAVTGKEYCDKLFAIEDDLKALSPEDRYTQRLDREKPVLEAFWAWLETVNPIRGSKLAKAVSYAQNQKPFMENYLLDGRCSLSNNAAENAIRPFVTGRKNWLFADTPKGADASATVYSLIETAKANGLDVFSYLQELLANMTDGQSFPEANAAYELSFNCIYSGRCPLGTIFLSAYNYSSPTYNTTYIPHTHRTSSQRQRKTAPDRQVLPSPLSGLSYLQTP